MPSQTGPDHTLPWRLDAGELTQAYANGAVTPVAALQSVLARLDEVNPGINAVITRDDAAAMTAAQASAARWSRGEPLSELDGVPISVKDNISVRGLPCRWGSRLFADHVPDLDETPVRRLRDAGAMIFAKTNVPEFTLQGFTANPLFGITRNPWNTSLTPGGSSGGAVAAVAAGIGPLALATDGGGSIRRPAAYTGLVGYKPSWDAVPRACGLPDMLPGLEVIGPIARNVADMLRILRVISPSLSSELSFEAAPRNLRILHWRSIAGSPVDPAISRQVDEVADRLRSLGHAVIAGEAPGSVQRLNRDAWPVLSASGLAHVVGERDTAGMTPAMADLLAFGRNLRAVDLFEAQRLVRLLRADMADLFSHCDLILTPSCAAMPWPAEQAYPSSIAGQAVDGRGHAVFTAFVNAAGLPAINLPAEPARLPIGFQLIGAPAADRLVCAIGRQFAERFKQALLW